MNIVIIGGNAAGMSAASQVKRQQSDWSVTVLEKNSYISYAACGIPYYVQGLVPDIDKLITVTPGEALQKRKINLKINQFVREINKEKQILTVESPEGVYTEAYDKLVIACGARPSGKEIDYAPAEGIFTAHNLDDADRMRTFIKTNKPRSAAVVGGGYIAVEMLEAFRELGLETHLLHRRTALSRSFEEAISSITLAEMEKEGVILHLNQEVKALAIKEKKVEVLSNDQAFQFDMVVVAAGVEPNSSLAKESGLQLGVKESIKVNSYLETSHPGIYAAGDCAETTQMITGEPIYLPLALKANKEGVIAGVNIGGGKEQFPGVLGSAVTKFCNLGIARTGLTLAEAEASGFDAARFKLEANSKSHYYPGSGTLTMILVADKKSRRLLGAQLAGPVDSVKRIDVYATVITAAMTIDQIFELDLAYAPPFSPVYDPVVLSGRVGRKIIDG